MRNDTALRKDLRVLLRGGRAHVNFDKAVADLPGDLRGKKPRGAPYSPWQQVESKFPIGSRVKGKVVNVLPSTTNRFFTSRDWQ